MRKRQIWLKLFVAVIIFQMVLMPVAPVLAEELNTSTVEAPVVVTETPIDPVVEVPTENIPASDTAPAADMVQPEVQTATENILPAQAEVPVVNIPTVAPIVENSSTPISSTTTPVKTENLEEKNYNIMMRRLNKLDKKGVDGATFDRFIQSEKDRLNKLGIDGSKQSDYLNFLEKQSRQLNNRPTPLTEKIMAKVKDVFGFGKKVNTNKDEFKIPEKPASFQFNNDAVGLKKLSGSNLSAPVTSLKDMYGQIFKVEDVSADNQYLPNISDVKADGGEVQINSEIQNLANSLQNNPVNILNYVRANISYEPYFGAKKGSVGCLHEGVCNDVDASSLTIALLRASGIPARYKSSVVEMSADQLKNLLGVDELKTVYIALAENKVPVYLVSSSTIPDGKAIDYDFSNETSLGLEWVYAEAYYDYDERGGNFSNLLSFSSASTTDDVHSVLQSYNKKQWVPLDAVVKNYNRTKNEIVHDTANFNMTSFWNNFLQYQGTLSPVQKYAADLKTATGKDINNASYQSSLVGADKDLPILPPTLPYYTHTGEVGGSLIQPTPYSVLPDSFRPQVKISLLREPDKSVVLSNTFYANQVNNADINLSYDGATDADKQIIESYGGIHATPATLVDISPSFVGDQFRYSTDNKIKIGDKLILSFEYISKGEVINADEKFSIAGNTEGIVISLSKILSDPNLDTNSKILLQGNTGLARKYLEHLQATQDLLQKSLDYRFNAVFQRAVVTQNRVLSEVDGVPTTFDFKGLSIDSGTYINDWSNRGLVTNHRKDFRMIWGEDASYYEGQLFDDITGLTGISTVKGLQYAYAHQETYTMHTITKTNEGEIDGLNLTDNTKTNMHLAVQEGNTVITPDKPIVDQNFNGILYIVLLPEGCGTYAIGEQTQGNGGTTVRPLVASSYIDDLAIYYWHLSYTDSNGEKKYFAYQDMPVSVDSAFCNLLESDFNSMQSDANWKSEYGSPCASDIIQFGLVSHKYLLATNAAKFYSSNKYNYWVKRSDAVNIIKTKVNIDKPEKFIFNPIAGTYSYRGSVAVYYQPVQPVNGQESGKAWKVEGKILSKLMDINYDGSQSYYCDENDDYCCGGKLNWVLKKLGYPLGPVKDAAKSQSGTNGYYQDFTGGQVYVETEWLDEAYYVPSEIGQTFNSSNYIFEGKIGTGGQFGFPLKDPVKVDNVLYQNFENGYRISATGNVKDNSFKISIQQDYSTGEYKDLMIDGFFDSFTKANVYGLAINIGTGIVINEAVQLIVKQAAKKLATKAAFRIGLRYVPVIGWVIGGLTVALAVDQNLPLYKACTQDPYLSPPNPILEGAKPAYYCGKLAGATALAGLGFLADYTAGKLNDLYASTANARIGKTKIFADVDSNYEGQELQKLLRDNPKVRDNFFEISNRLDGDSIDILASNPKISKRLLEEPIYQATFDGFVKGGNMNGKVKYRVDPYYSSQFSKYANPDNFNFQKLIKDGVSKQGFFSMSEMDEVIKIYNNMPSSNREIIFVKKLDGTTVITPRYKDVEFPHPVLAGGEDVVCAGTIKPLVGKNVEISRQTGHYKVHLDDLNLVNNELTNSGYNVSVNQSS